VANVVSAAAVVTSLLYVGYQIRENTVEVRTNNRQQLINRSMSATTTFTSPDVSVVLSRLRAGEELTPVELTQLGYIIRTLLYDVQEAFLLHREGRLDNTYWNTRVAVVLAYMEPTAAREIYRRDASIGALDPDFVQWLDGAITERFGD